MNGARLDRRPVMVVVAGPNGAGKTTFYHAFLSAAGLRFVNADDMAHELGVSAYEAAEACAVIRQDLIRQRESFVFETVFSDPIGDKLSFMNDAAAIGYNVILCYIGLGSIEISDERVAIRVTQGGHDVPPEKLVSRYPRSLANLKRAMRELPTVIIFDNSELTHPFEKVMELCAGNTVYQRTPLPDWLRELQ